MIVAAILLAAQTAPTALVGEIGERLRGPELFILSSQRQPQDLELCVADVISRTAAPASFRDGPNRPVGPGAITGAGTKVTVTVELNRSPNGTQIIARGYGKRSDDKLQAYLSRCL